MKKNKVVTREEWLQIRKEQLKKEKEFSQLRDQYTQSIRELPWVKIEKDYVFGSSSGNKTFADLFEGRSQLVIYHFMLGPGWAAGCKSCSFWADNFDNIIVHLNQRDVTMIAVSRATVGEIEAFKKRMGWSFNWYSAHESDFNYDFNVSFREGEAGIYNYKEMAAGGEKELPGISVFAKDEQGHVYHTYSRYARGLDLYNTAYHYLDIVPKGRDEAEFSYAQQWVRHKDSY